MNCYLPALHLVRLFFFFLKDPLPAFIDLEKSKLQHELAAQGAPLIQIVQEPKNGPKPPLNL